MKRVAFFAVAALLCACESDRGRDRDRDDDDEECGDGRADGGEVCDGDDLEGATCVSLGFGEGTLSCSSNCEDFDRSNCGAPATCGNGAIDAPELCDVNDLGGATCESLGYGAGTLGCANNCGNFDVSGCAPPDGCTPDCAARECGLEPVCGTSCGSCVDGDVCDDGVCGPAPVCLEETAICGSGECVLDVNPQLLTVSGELKYDDQVIRNAYVDYTEALVRFVNKQTFATYLYDQTDGATTYSIKIPRGTYDVFLDLESADVVDYLSDPIRVAADLSVQGTTTLDVNPQLITVSGEIRYDDQAIANAYADYTEALIRFVNRDTFNTYLYYQTDGATTYSLRIPAGRYDVFLDLESADVADYLGDPIRVAANVNVQSATTIDVNPQLVNVTGAIRYDDQAITNAYVDYTEALIRFVNRETFNTYLYYHSEGGTTYSIKLPLGRYDVFLDLESADVTDYLGDPIRVATDVSIQSATTIDVNPQLVNVTGEIRYDDQVITNAYVDYTEALIRFVNRETLNTYLYYQTDGAASYALKIPQGRYDVFLDLESADVVDYLSDPIRVATNIDVQSATTIDVNPQLVTVSGIIKYDDQSIANAYVDYTEALVRFTNKDTFSTYLYYQTEGGETYTLKVPQGRYDVFLDLESADVVDYLGDPIRVARDVEIASTTTVNVNPQLVEVRGEIRYDDQQITNAYADYTEALVRFTSRETFSSYLYYQTDGGTTYSIKVPAGFYDVFLDLESADVVDYLADPIRVGECVVIQ